MGEETPGKLDGLTIAVTREEPGELARLLADEGARVLHFPLIRIVASGSVALAAAVEQPWDWLVFTSVNAVLFMPGKVKVAAVACVGDATAQEARRAGYNVDLLPTHQHIKGMIEAFAALDKRIGRVLYPRSELAPRTLVEGLRALGFSVDDPVAYRTLPDTDGIKALSQQMGLQAIVFASPSAVRGGVKALGERLKEMRIYSIGPTTSHAVREAGHKVAAEAAEHSAAGLVQAVLEKEVTR